MDLSFLKFQLKFLHKEKITVKAVDTQLFPLKIYSIAHSLNENKMSIIGRIWRIYYPLMRSLFK